MGGSRGPVVYEISDALKSKEDLTMNTQDESEVQSTPPIRQWRRKTLLMMGRGGRLLISVFMVCSSQLERFSDGNESVSNQRYQRTAWGQATVPTEETLRVTIRSGSRRNRHETVWGCFSMQKVMLVIAREYRKRQFSSI